MAQKAQQRVERRLVVEYVEKTFRERLRVYYNLRVGKPPDAIRRQFPGIPSHHFRVWQSFVDALVVLPEEFVLIEAKVFNPQNAISQLKVYARKLYDTEELKIWGARPVRLLLVAAFLPPSILESARLEGIETEVYRPPWILPILQKRGIL